MGRRPPKQLPIEGMEPARIEAIEKAAEAYADIRNERMELTETEVKRKQTLIDVMKKHQQKLYRFDDHEVELVPGEDSVKVRKVKDAVPA